MQPTPIDILLCVLDSASVRGMTITEYLTCIEYYYYKAFPHRLFKLHQQTSLHLLLLLRIVPVAHNGDCGYQAFKLMPLFRREGEVQCM